MITGVVIRLVQWVFVLFCEVVDFFRIYLKEVLLNRFLRYSVFLKIVFNNSNKKEFKMGFAEDLKEFIFKCVRYPKLYKSTDAEARTLFRNIVGTQEALIDSGTETNVIPVWVNGNLKYEAISKSDYLNLLSLIPIADISSEGIFIVKNPATGEFELKTKAEFLAALELTDIIEEGGAFAKFPVWNNSNGVKKYQPQDDATYISNFYQYIQSNLVFWAENILQQNQALLPCVADVGIPVAAGMKIIGFSACLGANETDFMDTIAGENYVNPGQRLRVEIDVNQGGTYLTIQRVINKSTVENIYSGKISSLDAVHGVVVTLKTIPYIEPVS